MYWSNRLQTRSFSTFFAIKRSVVEDRRHNNISSRSEDSGCMQCYWKHNRLLCSPRCEVQVLFIILLPSKSRSLSITSHQFPITRGKYLAGDIDSTKEFLLTRLLELPRGHYLAGIFYGGRERGKSLLKIWRAARRRQQNPKILRRWTICRWCDRSSILQRSAHSTLEPRRSHRSSS